MTNRLLPFPDQEMQLKLAVDKIKTLEASNASHVAEVGPEVRQLRIWSVWSVDV